MIWAPRALGPLGGSTFPPVDMNVKSNCAADVGGVLGATRAARRAESLRLSDRPLLETGGLLRQTWRLAPCGELVERAARRKAGPAVEGGGWEAIGAIRRAALPRRRREI